MGIGALILQVLARLATAIGLTSAILSIAQAIYNALHPAGVAVDFAAFALDAHLAATEAVDPVSGFNALHNQIAALSTAVGLDFTTAIATITTNVKAAPAPAWYTPPGPSLAAADVWQYNGSPLGGTAAGDYLVDAGIAAESAGTGAALPAAAARYCLLHWDWSDDTALPNQTPAPAIDPLTILPTDVSVIAWLNRTTAPYTWSLFNTQIVSFHGLAISDAWWICTITELEFAQYKALLAPVTRTSPPVWPGLANVTLGTSHSLATGITITAPMDGVILAITAVPPGTGLYDFDGTLSYTFVGALSFVSDNGDQEFPQSIGFQSAVYSPREMLRAAGVKVRAKLGVVGTVTPWTIT